MWWRIKLIIIAILIGALSYYAFAAGTVVTTEYDYTSVKFVKFAWTASAGGAADATTTNYYDGRVIWAATDPGDGATSPTANWDVTVTDTNSLDVLISGGANRSQSAVEYIKEADLGSVSASKLTLAVTNAGNATTGIVYLFIR